MAEQVEVTKEDIDNFNRERKQIDETIEQLNNEIISLTKTIDTQTDEIAKYKGIIQGVAKTVIKAWAEMDS